MDARAVTNDPAKGTSHGALAHGRVTMLSATSSALAANTVKKGDVLATARLAGVQAAKQSSALLPLVDSSPAGRVTVAFVVGDGRIDVEARAEGADRASAEAQALSAVTICALTIYDMCKSVDRTMSIGAVGLGALDK